MTLETAQASAVALVLAVIGGCEDPSAPAAAPAAKPSTGTTTAPWFTEVTRDLGIDFTHESGSTGKLWMPEIMGPGVALFDYDNDEDLDCYLVTGNRTLPRAGTASVPVNRLYRQEADGTFLDVTEASGLGDGGYGMGVAVGDIDNDGFLDVYVSNYGPDRLYRNRGDGTFEAMAASGTSVDGWSTSAAFLDYDDDGFLDLFVTRYVEYDPERDCFDQAGRPDYCGPWEFGPVPDVLLHNNGDGTFRDVSNAAGIDTLAAAGLGVVIDDFNDDGRIDVYVANDSNPNHLWINQGDGTFREQAVLYGAAYNLHGEAEAGMGVVAADFDGDLYTDIFLTHLNQQTNTMYRRMGDPAGFVDVTGESGLGGSSMGFTGFGVAAFDVELDGDLDLFIAQGRVIRGDPRPGAVQEPPWAWFAEPNLFYTNDGTGAFTLEDQPVRSLCGPIEITRGTAVGDIDGDGDLDLVVTNVQGPVRVYRNDVVRAGSWLIVRAVDEARNRDALGARVYVSCGSRTLVRIISPAVGYLSASDVRAHFGLGPADRYDGIEVRWPDGSRERFPGGPANRSVIVARGRGEPMP